MGDRIRPVRQSLHTTGDLAAKLGVDPWRIRRIFEDGSLTEPTRICGRRMISADEVGAVVDELFRRGWLPAGKTAIAPEASSCN
jgi:hypothetical protein